MRAKVTVDLNKIKQNSAIIQQNCSQFGVSIAAVTKMHSASEPICAALIDSGIGMIADSRIENLAQIEHLNCEKWLLRLPALSICEDVVKYSDVSMNSETCIIDQLNLYALKHAKTHNVILMWDLGDLREGYFDRKELSATVQHVQSLSNIRLYGIGTNLSCYGGIMPTMENLQQLAEIGKSIENDVGLSLQYISGGNSTSYTLIHDGIFPEGVNHIRIGDTFYFGRDMSRRIYIEGMQHDCFVLSCEIIEIKEKPSVPIGVQGYAALNTKPMFENKGIRKRAICSVGKQDIDLDMIPRDPQMCILGASSDHLLIDITDCDTKYRIGDIVCFNMLYTATMRAFTSKYIDKEFIG